MKSVLTEASIRIVTKFICCECERNQHLTRFKSPLSSLSNSSIASTVLPDKLATWIIWLESCTNQFVNKITNKHRILKNEIINQPVKDGH